MMMMMLMIEYEREKEEMEYRTHKVNRGASARVLW